jgi:hypothetical protein
MDRRTRFRIPGMAEKVILIRFLRNQEWPGHDSIGLEQDGVMIGLFHVDSPGTRDFSNHPVDHTERGQILNNDILSLLSWIKPTLSIVTI